MMTRDEEGKVRCVDKKIEDWICQKRMREGSSVTSSDLNLGGKGGASKDVQTDRNHVASLLPRKFMEKIDVGVKHGPANNYEGK